MQKEAQHFDKLDMILIGNSIGEGMVAHEPSEVVFERRKSHYDPVAAIETAKWEGFPHGDIIDFSEKASGK